MIVNLQILRAFAAMLVVWVHTYVLLPETLVPAWTGRIGYGGVDLFFVLSGFIMVRTTVGNPLSPAAFMRKRISRIVPLYYVFTILTAVVAMSLPHLMNSTQLDTVQIIKSLLFIPFEKTPDRIYPVLYLGWTLNYEMFFYLIFSASLAFGRSIRILFVAGLLGLLVIAGRGIENLNEYGVIPFFLTRPILLDFALGMLIAVALSGKWVRFCDPLAWWSALLAGTVWLVFGGEAFPIGSSGVAPMTDTFLRFGMPAGLIVMGAVGLEQTGIRIGGPHMKRLGDASYSLYLSHYFVIATCSALADFMVLGDHPRILLAILAMSAAVVGGILTFRLIERPLAGDFSAYRRLGQYLVQRA